tara:strand:+ start:110 stop:505 length:396 start_codon:yes stop_codon:yes gene_type:complete
MDISAKSSIANQAQGPMASGARPAASVAASKGNVADVKVALPDKASIDVPEFKTKDIQKAINELQAYVDKMGRNVDFRMDNSIDRPVVTVRDSNTQELVRQIPTQEVVEMAARLEDTLQEWKAGFFFDNKM